VNLLLVDASELGPTADVTLTSTDRRAVHLRTVLDAAHVGARVRAGVVGGALGEGEVTAVASDGALTLRLALAQQPPPRLPIELVLAVPRPKALTRVIEAVASFDIERIALTNAWRVDKAYLRSPRLAPEALAHAARLGAEQGGTTHVPAIELHERLMTLLDARFPAPGRSALIAHPGAPPIETLRPTGPVTLAIGPDGGWIEREIESFVARGFAPVSLARTILRTETAVAAALGQLALLLR